MSARILEGEPLARAIREVARREIDRHGARPRVAAVHHPGSPAARYYLRQQKKLFAEAGIDFDVRTLAPETGEAALVAVVETLNRDAKVAGITVHAPLPPGVDVDRVMRSVSPVKDLEGMHPENLGRLAFGEHLPAPCAAGAAVELARAACPSFKGMDAVVVGRSALVGKSIALLLLQSKAEAPTPTICHTGTRDLAAHTRRADLLFVAAGRAGLVRGDMVKPGAVVIDVGINETPEGSVVGDVAFAEAVETASAITPVPGGVGPVSLALLLRNLAACLRR